MATREQARVALVTAVEALKSTWTAYTLLIEYDNRVVVNRATHSNPFLCVDMVFMDGYQTTLGNRGYRSLGTVVLEANVKEGSGKKLANELLEHFFPTLQMTDAYPPLRMHAAKFGSRPAREGWVAEAAVIPFWYDTL
jgi:hypothetical protein